MLILIELFCGKMAAQSPSLCCNGPTAPSLNWLMKRFNGLAALLPGGPVLRRLPRCLSLVRLQKSLKTNYGAADWMDFLGAQGRESVNPDVPPPVSLRVFSAISMVSQQETSPLKSDTEMPTLLSDERRRRKKTSKGRHSIGKCQATLYSDTRISFCLQTAGNILR